VSWQVIDIVLECVCELPVKTSLYATLVALLNCSRHEFVGALLTRAQAALRRSLKLGAAEATRARILTRFLAACATCRAVSFPSALQLLRSLVDAALAAAARAEGDAGDDGAWQPRADSLVYAALAAVPFAGQELPDGNVEGMEAFLLLVSDYLARRRVRGVDAQLRPLRAADEAQAAESGEGEDYVEELWGRIQVCAGSGVWDASSLARTRVHVPFKAQLETGSTPHALTDLPVPDLAPGLAPASYAAALVAFPPRPRLRLLDARQTEGDASRAPIERFVAEELMGDTLWAWEEGARFGKAHMAAEQLAQDLPLDIPHEQLLAETLFAHALALPRSTYRAVYLAALLQDLCKGECGLSTTFPPALGAVVGRCFRALVPCAPAGAPLLHPAAAATLAEVLSVHLAATGLGWPWTKWEAAAAQPMHHPQRRFLADLLQRLQRLSYHARVALAIPESLRPLLGPAPAPEAGWPYGDAHAPKIVGVPDEAPLGRSLIALCAAKASAEELWACMQAAMLELGATRCAHVLATVLAHHGRKTITHLNTMFTRYAAPLAQAAQAAGGANGAGGVALLHGVAAHAMACHTQQQMWIAAERLQALGVVPAEGVVVWAFSPDTRPMYAHAAVWNALELCLEREVADVSLLKVAAERAWTAASDAADYTLILADQAAAAAEAAADPNDWVVRQAVQAEQAALNAEDQAAAIAADVQEKLSNGDEKLRGLLWSVAEGFSLAVAECASDAQSAAESGDAARKEAALAAHVAVHDAFRLFAARHYGDAGSVAAKIGQLRDCAPAPVHPVPEVVAA